METLSAPLQRVAEASEWFIRTPSLRLLYIVTSGVLRLAVLEQLTATELLDVNGCPFFVLEAPTEIDDDGWMLRSDCPWRRPGQYDDDFGVEYYHRHRYYSPLFGTYISLNPAGLAGYHGYADVPDPLTWVETREWIRSRARCLQEL